MLIRDVPKFPIKSIASFDGIDRKLVSPIISFETLMPLTLIGISLLESSIELTIIPLFSANNSFTNNSVFFPEREILELSNSNSIFVFEYPASDLVWLTSGALLIINSSWEPSSLKISTSSPRIR